MTVASVERAVALAVLAAVAWPAVGPSVHPAFRRSFPALARRLTRLLLAYAAGSGCSGRDRAGLAAPVCRWSWTPRPHRRSVAHRGRARAPARLADGIAAAVDAGPLVQTGLLPRPVPEITAVRSRPASFCVRRPAWSGCPMGSTCFANTTPRWCRRRGPLAASSPAGSSGTCRESATPPRRRCSARPSCAMCTSRVRDVHTRGVPRRVRSHGVDARRGGRSATPAYSAGRLRDLGAAVLRDRTGDG